MARSSLPRPVIDAVLEAFLVLPNDLFPSTDGLGQQPLAKLVSDAFKGLSSVASAATLPYQLVSNAVHARRFDRFSTAERIRGLVPFSSNLTEDEEQAAHNRATDRMNEMLASTDGIDEIRDAIFIELHRSLSVPALSSAASELSRQSVVATWSVFETFATSYIVQWLNEDPKRAKPFVSDVELKKVFGKGFIDLDIIGSHDFDLTHAMGTVMFKGRRFDSLHNIRAALNAIFPNGEIRAALGDTMWALNQRRHLLVHKRGIVDQEYLDKTGDQVKLGGSLKITSAAVESYLVGVRDAVEVIATASAKED